MKTGYVNGILIRLVLPSINDGYKTWILTMPDNIDFFAVLFLLLRYACIFNSLKKTREYEKLTRKRININISFLWYKIRN